jgi:hypothetical protein
VIAATTPIASCVTWMPSTSSSNAKSFSTSIATRTCSIPKWHCPARENAIAAPISAVIAWAKSSVRSSSRSLIRVSSAIRSSTEVCENEANARRAAATARSTSAALPAAMWPITSSE